MPTHKLDANLYEKITKCIYEEILRGEGYENVEVRHNISLQGLKGTHQIDVFWKLNYANLEHSVIIECKNYSRPIDISIVRSFESVVNDIRNAKGIIVTRSGAQKGAIEYAKKCGISIKKLDIDLKNGHDIKTNIKLEFDYDIRYDFEDKTTASKVKDGKIRLPDRHSVKFFDIDGKELQEIKEFVSGIILSRRVTRGDRFSVKLVNDNMTSIRALDMESLKTVCLSPSSIYLDIVVTSLGLNLKFSWGEIANSILHDVISAQNEYSAKIFLKRKMIDEK